MNLKIFIFLACIWLLLAVATGIVWYISKKNNQPLSTSELMARTKSWWLMLGLFTLAVVINHIIATIFLAFISFIALKEFFSIIATRPVDRRVLLLAYAAVPLQYFWAFIQWYGMFIIFIPVYMFLLIPFRMILLKETEGFLKSIGTIQWGLMITVFAISHAAYLLGLPDNFNGLMTGTGLLIFLFFLTQMNDVAQYVFGKLYGKEKIIPEISPNKTWAGLIGGIITTIILALISSPFLTVFSWQITIILAVLISVSGFIGDVTISAIKRDLGIKDTGQLIKGHGGILDRIDSLTFTAPVFFHVVYYIYY